MQFTSKFMPETVETILSLRRTGKTLRECAQAAGIAPITLKKWLAKSRSGEFQPEFHQAVQSQEEAHRVDRQNQLIAKYKELGIIR